jgi:hypothetical protein
MDRERALRAERVNAVRTDPSPLDEQLQRTRKIEHIDSDIADTEPTAKKRKLQHAGAKKVHGMSDLPQDTTTSSVSKGKQKAPGQDGNTGEQSSEERFWDGELRSTYNIYMDTTEKTFKLKDIIGEVSPSEFLRCSRGILRTCAR